MQQTVKGSLWLHIRHVFTMCETAYQSIKAGASYWDDKGS